MGAQDINIFRDAGERGNDGGIALLTFQKGGTGAEVTFS